MDLRTYLDQERGRAAELARSLKLAPVLLSQWASGDRPVPVNRCIPIERATHGAVTCEELRSDLSEDWSYLRATDCERHCQHKEAA